jgi:putative CocE/NonD family hydrolase
MFVASTRSVCRTVCAIFALTLTAASSAAKEPVADYTIRLDEKITLADGAVLSASVYQPKGIAKAPIIFTLTPYMADKYHARADYFARHGYAFALVDARGRGNSTGKFDPLRQERIDAAEVVNYFAAAAYGTGEVTMWGGSYAGYNQWCAAAKQPRGLFTIVPVASPYPGLDFPLNGNQSYPYVMQWLTLTSGQSAQENLFAQGDFWQQKGLAVYRGERPFVELDQIVGNPSPIFQEWLQHPTLDAYWQAMSPSQAEMQGIDLPILSITGMYDGDQPGALAYYRQHLSAATAHAQAQHYLVIGPWDHPGTRTPQAQVGGLTLGAASLLDMNALHLAWYDFARGKGKRPELLEDQVTWFQNGADQWRHAKTLAAVTVRQDKLYFASPNVNPVRLFTAGTLQKVPPSKADTDSYVYDPRSFRRGELELAAGDADNALTTEALAFAIDQDGLVYHSEAFAQDTDLAGFFAADLRIAIDVPDTDIQVSIFAIGPNGGSVFLTEQRIRARYRKGIEAPQLTPNHLDWYHFDAFTFAARTLVKGSRLRVLITAPDSIGAQRNFNSGGVVAQETIADARKATVRLMLDPISPSFLSIPIAAK